MNYYANQFEDDEENNSNNDKSSSNPDYVFEGFTVELNEKIMLTPVAPTTNNY